MRGGEGKSWLMILYGIDESIRVEEERLGITLSGMRH